VVISGEALGVEMRMNGSVLEGFATDLESRTMKQPQRLCYW
jgi:hypothetical protein